MKKSNGNFGTNKWVTAAYISQLLTAAIHSLSFVKEPIPQNATEKQLMDLMTNYKQNLGAGFSPTTSDIMTALSACMTLLCLASGLTLWRLSRSAPATKTMQGIMAIQTIVFGIGFVVMLFFTFLPPIVCFGLIFISCGGAYLNYFRQKE